MLRRHLLCITPPPIPLGPPPPFYSPCFATDYVTPARFPPPSIAFWPLPAPLHRSLPLPFPAGFVYSLGAYAPRAALLFLDPQLGVLIRPLEAASALRAAHPLDVLARRRLALQQHGLACAHAACKQQLSKNRQMERM